MSLSRDAILLDNIKACLVLYQRGLMWATTAALTGLLLALRLDAQDLTPVKVLSGSISVPLAWALTQLLYLIFGALALAALRHYQTAVEELAPTDAILKAIRLFPSLATFSGHFFRLGSVLLPVLATAASWIIEIRRERADDPPGTEHSWMGALLIAVILLSPYLGILAVLRSIRLHPPQPAWPPAANSQSPTPLAG